MRGTYKCRTVFLGDKEIEGAREREEGDEKEGCCRVDM